MMASSCGRDRSSPRDGSGFGRIGCLLHQAEEHAIMNRVETEDSSYASARNRKLLAEWAAKTGENEYAEPALNPCQTTAYAFFTGDELPGRVRAVRRLRGRRAGHGRPRRHAGRSRHRIRGEAGALRGHAAVGGVTPSPRDLGGAAVFLASSAADYVHGVVLPIDGGWLVR